MLVEQKQWTKEKGWKDLSSHKLADKAQLVLVFGDRVQLGEKKHFDSIREMYPKSNIVLCSTAGEIIETKVQDGTLGVTAVYFKKANLSFSQTAIEDTKRSEEAGQKLGKSLKHDGLVHAMVFSDGLKVNGTSLVKGLTAALPKSVSVTGGLVGDGTDFKKTLVGLNASPQEGNIVLIGFYGDSLKIGYGSLGGWDPFGVNRIITKSEGNVLYELDGKPALEVYKKYLGEQAKGLPGTGLLFPLLLHMNTERGKVEVVRTILGVDEKTQSMTFAGDMPKGASAMLMKANFENLIDGAGGAAFMSKEPLGAEKAQLAILISCIGRKLVLKERIEEEVEAVQDKIGKQAALTGFYSYGEICPTAATEKQCQLHNQTMTITTFRETD